MVSFDDIPGVDLVIHEITGGNVARLDALLELFEELFPQYAPALPRVRQRAHRPADANPLFVEHQWLADVDGQAAGMIAFKYVPKRNLGLGTYLAIRPAYRKLSFGKYGRLSELLVVAAKEQLRDDALDTKRPPPAGMVVEVEVPKLIPHYRKYGFIELPVEYHEVRFSQGCAMRLDPDELEKVEFHQVQLGIFPLDEKLNVNNPTLLSNAVLAFLIDNYGLSEEHWVVHRALESIN